MGAPASQSRWEISSPTQGNKRLRRVQSSQVSSDAKREAVTAQGEDDPIGTVFSPGAKNISLTVYTEQGTPEVDWDALFRSGEYFRLTRRIVGGKSFQYVDCQVSTDPNPDDDNQGKHTFSVSVLAMRVLPL
jgi:hypothetical protein